MGTLTPARLANGAVAAVDYLLGREHPRSMPMVAKLETANLCNLRCPYCLHGEDPRGEAFRNKRYMTLETFQTVIDQMGRHLLALILYHKGEPFLNKELLDMCALAREQRIATIVSSNFSLKFTDAEIEDIVQRGPTYLTISLDGITQEIYETYRVGGKIDLVLDNLRRLVAAKRQREAASPIIAWQFIDFDHNRHQLVEAERLAREIGVDNFVVTRNREGLTHDGHKLGALNRAPARTGRFPFKCKWLWTLPVILYDGESVPCCDYDWRRDKHMGNISGGFASIWHGADYALNRRIVTNQSSCIDHPNAHCAACPLKG
ncbi:hypothetical protein CU669_10975 [Paramagnetospirillum kuznetsovii]|uniref:Radical SAM core domain-containing protein n=2 Tax=Paramagnetospirillum kuznetsovii TaxID=2053833 RepID=A0A364NXJ7_9PROT|nr:hypothetical protein CU669_10975 [Paramagnetospirillum kuznetsovii]